MTMTAAEHSRAVAKVLVEIRDWTPEERSLHTTAALLRYEHEVVMAAIRDAGKVGISTSRLSEILMMDPKCDWQRVGNIIHNLRNPDKGLHTPRDNDGNPIPFIQTLRLSGMTFQQLFVRDMPSRSLRTEIILKFACDIPDYRLNNGYQWNGEDPK